jgi:formate hydrogenlyase transcriptional activator
MAPDVNSAAFPEYAQALFKELFLASPDAIVVTAADGRISAANPAVERLFGYCERELIGNLVEILLPERLRRDHPRHRTHFVASPSMRPMGTGLELYGRRKDGSEFPVDIMLSPVETSGTQSILTVVRDITQRKQTETALRRSEERFRSLVETMQSSCSILRVRLLPGILVRNESRGIAQKRS